MPHDLLFETNRFNLSEVQAHFINPGCFGEDAATWLRVKLVERGIQVDEPGQEDWGWYLGAKYAGRSYLLGVGGTTLEPAGDRNHGEWRIIVEPHRSFWEWLTRAGRPPGSDEFLALIREILAGEPAFTKVRSEPDV